MSKLKSTDLINDISLLIEQSQRNLAIQANSTLTLLFWKIGRRINDDILQNKRADYGKQIVATVATKLEKLYGRSFSERNLRRMVQFSELFPDLNIVTPLASQLSWSHFIELFPLKTEEARMFYAMKTKEEQWSKRELKNRVSLGSKIKVGKSNKVRIKTTIKRTNQ